MKPDVTRWASENMCKTVKEKFLQPDMQPSNVYGVKTTMEVKEEPRLV